MSLNPDPKLSVCGECGWYGLYGHAACCAPLANKRAAALEAAIPGIASTRFGYGHRKLTFEFGPQAHITLSVHDAARERRPFSVENVWLIQDLDASEAEDLIRTFDAWQNRVRMRRSR